MNYLSYTTISFDNISSRYTSTTVITLYSMHNNTTATVTATATSTFCTTTKLFFYYCFYNYNVFLEHLF